MILELPYPPSVNGYWRSFNGRQIISAKGREYREHVTLILRSQQIERMEGRLAVSIILHPPDKRRRDLDNVLKSLCDSLQHGGAYEDDSQIDELRIMRGPQVEGGEALVQIEPIQPPESLTDDRDSDD